MGQRTFAIQTSPKAFLVIFDHRISCSMSIFKPLFIDKGDSEIKLTEVEVPRRVKIPLAR